MRPGDTHRSRDRATVRASSLTAVRLPPRAPTSSSLTRARRRVPLAVEGDRACACCTSAARGEPAGRVAVGRSCRPPRSSNHDTTELIHLTVHLYPEPPPYAHPAAGPCVADPPPSSAAAATRAPARRTPRAATQRPARCHELGDGWPARRSRLHLPRVRTDLGFGATGGGERGRPRLRVPASR